MQTYTGTCHCGAVKFEVDMDLADPFRCNCTFCIRRGAVRQKVPVQSFRLLQGDPDLVRYGGRDFSNHFFCARCGIHVFTKITRANEDTIAVSLGCPSDLDLESVVPRIFDGARLL